MKRHTTKIIIAFIIGIMAFIIYGYRALYTPSFIKENTKTMIVINKGASITAIGEKLERAKLISNANWFRLYTYFTGTDKKIKSGTYKIPSSLSLVEIVNFLIANNQEVYYNPNKLTIPEGLTIEQLSSLFSAEGFGTKSEVIKILRDGKLASKILGIEVTSFEGLIFPKTYFYEDSLSFTDFLKDYPLKNFQKYYGDDIFKKDFYDNLILASIVEKESGSASEKPMIASVFKNRLAKGMYLASCATHNKIFYMRGRKPPKKLYNKHLEIDSPYNTYRNKGLPPTPICSPSKESYDAVVGDFKSDYLFFFADFKGNNIFSKTHREHINKKNRIWNKKRG